jgi:hypothetical protein
MLMPPWTAKIEPCQSGLGFVVEMRISASAPWERHRRDKLVQDGFRRPPESADDGRRRYLETGAKGAQESRGEGDGEDSEFGPAEGQNVSGEKIWGLFCKLTVTQVRRREYLLGFSEKCPESYISFRVFFKNTPKAIYLLGHFLKMPLNVT